MKKRTAIMYISYSRRAVLCTTTQELSAYCSIHFFKPSMKPMMRHETYILNPSLPFKTSQKVFGLLMTSAGAELPTLSGHLNWISPNELALKSVKTVIQNLNTCSSQKPRTHIFRIENKMCKEFFENSWISLECTV